LFATISSVVLIISIPLALQLHDKGKVSFDLNNLKAIKESAKVLFPPLTIEIHRETAILLLIHARNKHLSALGNAGEIPFAQFPIARSIHCAPACKEKQLSGF
jgi:hypothetical protein